MNRKIEFNAWIPEIGFMVEDVAYGHGTIGFPSDYEGLHEALKAKGFDTDEDLDLLPEWLYDTGEDWYQITADTKFVLLQFTGLKDKNGKDIYEGDILRTVTDKPMVVSWNNKFASFCLNREGWAFTHWFGESCNPEDTEVIGNIYEHPHLMQKGGASEKGN